jgi:hypothetical protein
MTNTEGPWRQKQQEIHSRWACKSSIRIRATIAICIRASIYHSFRFFQRCGHLLSSKIYQVELLDSYSRLRGMRLVERRGSVLPKHLHLLILLQEGNLNRYRRRSSIPIYLAASLSTRLFTRPSVTDVRTLSSDLNGELDSRDIDAAGITTRGPRSVSRSVTVIPGLPSHRNSSPVEGELAEIFRWLCARYSESIDVYKNSMRRTKRHQNAG